MSNLAKTLRKKLSDFGNEAPLLSLFYVAVVGFTVVDVMSSFSLPRGSGPFSPKANLGSVGHFTDSQKASLKQIEGELNKASQMHASQADRIAQLGATTSTSTTTSSSHPPIVRQRMQEHAGGGLSGFHGAGMGHCNCASPSCPSCKQGVGFHHGVGGKDSRQLPPGLRRRMMSRTYESQVAGAHLGKQDLSTSDRAHDNAMKSMSGMFDLQGVMPESDGGWTE